MAEARAEAAAAKRAAARGGGGWQGHLKMLKADAASSSMEDVEDEHDHDGLIGGARTKTEPYVVPTGGLFELVACPHYLCEIVAWAAGAAIAPSIHTALAAGWVASMLAGRSVATTKWYRARFGGAYPRDRAHLVPFVF